MTPQRLCYIKVHQKSHILKYVDKLHRNYYIYNHDTFFLGYFSMYLWSMNYTLRNSALSSKKKDVNNVRYFKSIMAFYSGYDKTAKGMKTASTGPSHQSSMCPPNKKDASM